MKVRKMRDRDKIEDDLEDYMCRRDIEDLILNKQNNIIIEVLLDIRDLLIKE